MLLTRQNRIRIAQIVLSAITMAGFIAAVFGSGKIGAVIGLTVSTILLTLNSYTKVHDLGELAHKHKQAANSLWLIREQYLSLLLDVAMKEKPLEALQQQRDKLAEQLHTIYSSAPATNTPAYREAQQALQKHEDMTFSDEDIDALLPRELKRISPAQQVIHREIGKDFLVWAVRLKPRSNLISLHHGRLNLLRTPHLPVKALRPLRGGGKAGGIDGDPSRAVQKPGPRTPPGGAEKERGCEPAKSIPYIDRGAIEAGTANIAGYRSRDNLRGRPGARALHISVQSGTGGHVRARMPVGAQSINDSGVGMEGDSGQSDVKQRGAHDAPPALTATQSRSRRGFGAFGSNVRAFEQQPFAFLQHIRRAAVPAAGGDAGRRNTLEMMRDGHAILLDQGRGYPRGRQSSPVRHRQ